MGKSVISLFGQFYPYKSRDQLLFLPKPFPLKWRRTIHILTAPFDQKIRSSIVIHFVFTRLARGFTAKKKS
jgi:hypothetical protein